MKKLVAVYKCRYCKKFNEVDSKEGPLPNESFIEPFDDRLLTLHEDTGKVTTWVISGKPYTEFKMVILKHCSRCNSSVVLLDLVKIYIKDVK